MTRALALFLLALAATTDVQATPASVDQRPPVSRALRIPAEAAGGLLGGVVCGVGTGVLYAAFNGARGLKNLENTLVGATVGLMAGIPLGTWGTGKLLRADGALWATFVGAAVGLGAGLGANFALDNNGLVFLVAMPIAGAVTGFELTVSDPNAGVELTPSAGMLSGQPVVGVAARF